MKDIVNELHQARFVEQRTAIGTKGISKVNQSLFKCRVGKSGSYSVGVSKIK